MPRPVPTLQASLILMRPIAADADAQAYYEYALDPELHRWTGNNVLPSVEAAYGELVRLAGDSYLSVWLIVDRASATLAGRFILCLEQRGEERVVGEGNRIARRFWRCGHNREARSLMFRYAFEVLRADRYETQTWENNVNSVRSIEAHGFHFVRAERHYSPKHAQTMTLRHYARSAADWRLREE